MNIDQYLKAGQDVWKCFAGSQEEICQGIAHELAKELDNKNTSNVEKVSEFFIEVCKTDEGIEAVFKSIKKQIGIVRMVMNSLDEFKTWSIVLKTVEEKITVNGVLKK